MKNKIIYYLKILFEALSELLLVHFPLSFIYFLISVLSTLPITTFCFTSFLDFRVWIWEAVRRVTLILYLSAFFQTLLISYCFYISIKHMTPSKKELTRYYSIRRRIIQVAALVMASINFILLDSQTSLYIRRIFIVIIIGVIIALLLLLGDLKNNGFKQTSSFNLYFFIVVITSTFNYAFFGSYPQFEPSFFALLIAITSFALLFFEIGKKIKEHYKNEDEGKIDFILFIYSFAIFILGTIGIFSPQALNRIIQNLPNFK